MQTTKTKQKMNKATVLLTAGHGGIIDGQYMTDPKQGKKSPIWDNGKQLFEGEFNRQVKYRVMELLHLNGYKYIDVVPEHIDIKRSERIKRINEYYKTNKNCFSVDIHANAGKGTGIELWIANNASARSQAIAEQLELAYNRSELPLKFRGIKRKDFDMVALTNCPSVLVENPFMDTEEECQNYLLTRSGRDVLANWIYQGIIQAIDVLNR